MGAKYRGLTPEEVVQSRAKYGENRLTPPEKESLWKAYLEKYKDPLIIVLLVVMVFSIGVATFEYLKLGEPASVFLEPLGVLVALLLATTVGFIFEVKAAREFDVLNQVNEDTPVKVVRQVDGTDRIQEIMRCEVVVGDIVLVETGEEIPADGLLLESVSLSVNESTLTGEPIAHKWADPSEQQSEKKTTYAPNQLMKGTQVMEGHGVMQAQKVGDSSEYGQVCEAIQINDGVQTPLNRQLEQLGKQLSKYSFYVAGLILVGRLTYLFLDGNPTNNDSFIEVAAYVLKSIMIAVTLIVVSVPEGLPLSITLSLALSMKRMLKQNNLVRKLHACETMGAATVICTDKTGTLTQNQMRVAEMRNFMAETATSPDDKKRANSILDEAIAVNSTAWLETDTATPKVLGNPTEGALLLWLLDRGVDYLPLREGAKVINQEPFTTETKRMATTVESPLFGHQVTYVKGAPEMVLDLCSRVAGNTSRQEILTLLKGFQQQAMRTLGFAYCEGNSREFVFVGIVAIADPVRTEVPAAISTCMKAGIRVIIVTGDTPGTASEVGRQIGLFDANEKGTEIGAPAILTGPEFGAMSDEELCKVLPKLKILSRARPLDKQRLVKLLQSQQQVVAVTGDGTNDAPALNAAQVGLSMGDGTSVAKEASDITIIDNSFGSIVNAVMWGRSLYNNIGRFILFQMTVNVAACFIVLVGAFMGIESPLSVTQMLWVNLIMDTFAAMALSALPPEKSVMQAQPRSPKAHIINKQMLKEMLGWGVSMSLVLLACWKWLPHYMFFTIFVMMQFWNLFNARYFRTGRSVLGELFQGKEGLRTMKCSWSWGFMGIAALILLGQVLIVNLGGEMFNVVQPLTVREWIYIFAATFPIFLVGDIIRFVKNK